MQHTPKLVIDFVYSALLIPVITFNGIHHLCTLINAKPLSANYQTSFTCNGQEMLCVIYLQLNQAIIIQVHAVMVD